MDCGMVYDHGIRIRLVISNGQLANIQHPNIIAMILASRGAGDWHEKDREIVFLWVRAWP
jgi:hypothetical protein